MKKATTAILKQTDAIMKLFQLCMKCNYVVISIVYEIVLEQIEHKKVKLLVIFLINEMLYDKWSMSRENLSSE